jgi:hypothetical protein
MAVGANHFAFGDLGEDNSRAHVDGFTHVEKLLACDVIEIHHPVGVLSAAVGTRDAFDIT